MGIAQIEVMQDERKGPRVRGRRPEGRVKEGKERARAAKVEKEEGKEGVDDKGLSEGWRISPESCEPQNGPADMKGCEKGRADKG